MPTGLDVKEVGERDEGARVAERSFTLLPTDNSHLGEQGLGVTTFATTDRLGQIVDRVSTAIEKVGRALWWLVLVSCGSPPAPATTAFTPRPPLPPTEQSAATQKLDSSGALRSWADLVGEEQVVRRPDLNKLVDASRASRR